jgi:hypothetical protein
LQTLKECFREARATWWSEKVCLDYDQNLSTFRISKCKVQSKFHKKTKDFRWAHSNINMSGLLLLFNRDLWKTKKRARRAEMAGSFRLKTQGVKPCTIKTICKAIGLAQVRCWFKWTENLYLRLQPPL